MRAHALELATRCLLAAALYRAAAGAAPAADAWPQFRGPAGDGVADAATPPLTWSAEENILWSVEVPGAGWSQPVIWGDRVFLTTAVAEEQLKPRPGDWGPGGGLGAFFGFSPKPPDTVYRWQVLCLDADTGEILWETTAKQGKPTTATHRNNTYASETPVTDGERVIASFGAAGLYCYDFSGALLWSRDLGSHPMQLGWGTGSSPVLDGERVFLQCDNERESFLVALDKTSGEELWRVPRDEKSNWSTPYIWRNKLRTELVTAGGTRIRSYDPATGALNWEMDGHGRTSITPVGDHERLYADSYDKLTGRTGVLVAVRAGASGDVSLRPGEKSNEHVAWGVPLSAYRVASPLLYRGRLHVLEQQSGIVRCFAAETGELLYRDRLPRGKAFTASPVAAGGRIYCVDQSGLTTVLEPGDGLKVLAENELEQDMYWASPAVSGGTLFIRSLGRLYCVAHRAKARRIVVVSPLPLDPPFPRQTLPRNQPEQ